LSEYNFEFVSIVMCSCCDINYYIQFLSYMCYLIHVGLLEWTT